MKRQHEGTRGTKSHRLNVRGVGRCGFGAMLREKKRSLDEGVIDGT